MATAGQIMYLTLLSHPAPFPYNLTYGLRKRYVNWKAVFDLWNGRTKLLVRRQRPAI